jgi:hypothetical protein
MMQLLFLMLTCGPPRHTLSLRKTEADMNEEQRIKWLQDKLCGLALGSHIRRRYEEELRRLLDE